jgi:DNA-binding NtrC family response regulator
MMAGSDTIDTEDLPASLRMAQAHGAAASADGSFEESERELILRTLQAAGGNESKTARILRIGRDALRYKVRKYNLRAREAAKVASAG